MRNQFADFWLSLLVTLIKSHSSAESIILQRKTKMLNDTNVALPKFFFIFQLHRKRGSRRIVFVSDHYENVTPKVVSLVSSCLVSQCACASFNMFHYLYTM